jgi:hypothetical protein
MRVKFLDGREEDIKVGNATMGRRFESVNVTYEDIKEEYFLEWFAISVLTRLWPKEGFDGYKKK